VIARFATWTFDSDRRLVTEESGEVVHLTPKAFDLLTILIVEAPRVVRKDELHRRLWPGAFVSDATLVGLVKEIRRAFRTDGADASSSGRRTASATRLPAHWTLSPPAGTRRVPGSSLAPGGFA
jgi:DNA-binding response OmpR family regulator